MDHAVTYIRIYFLGMIPNLLYNMGAGISSVQWEIPDGRCISSSGAVL